MTQFTRRRVLQSMAAAGAALAMPSLLPTGARAQGAYPQRASRLIVPFAAGGNIDVMGRIMAARLSETLGQQFVVENRVGGGGIVGTEAVVRAEPDGHTLLWGSTNVICIVPHTGKTPYDPFKDLTPISALGMSPQVLVVNGKLPVKTLAEFVAWVKAQPQKQSYGGGGGPGSASNLMMSLFLKRADIEMTSVSYRGTAPALNDLIAGHIPVTFVPMSEAVAQAGNPNVRILAVTSAKRSKRLPDTPSVGETYAGYNAVSWTGMLGPAGLPKEIVDKLAGEMTKAGDDPKFVDQLVKQGVEPMIEGPQKFAEMIAEDYKTWGEAVKIAGVKR
jgi:tripartite-type tricarboxylate transporter receptor subunit TctC